MKYKPGDYIKVLDKADKDLIGRVVRIYSIEQIEHYMIDLLDYPCSYYPIWSMKACEENSELVTSMNILFNDRIIK
jgi:hypothetical protein